MKINPKRILIATQGPNKEPFPSEIEILFKSLITYGGKLADAQKLACFTEQPDLSLIKKLEKLNVKIKIVSNIDKRSPHSNKIQMLTLNKNEDFDVLVALDSDIVITNDFSEFIDLENFRAKPVDHDPFTMKNWEKIYQYFRVKFPDERYLTSFRNADTISYFNSGVLIIPEKYLSNLYDNWRSFITKLLDSYDELPEFKERSFFTDQIALSLAITKIKIPKKSLPLEMNFPTNDKIHESFKPEQSLPFLLHYHHFSESGIIRHCHYENINRLIDNINQKLIEEIPSDDKLISSDSVVKKILKKFSFTSKKFNKFNNKH